MIRTGTRFDARGNHPRRYASTATPMQSRQDSWPFGPRFDFGISISGVDVTVYPGLFYDGGTPYETAETTLTLTSVFTAIVLRFTPGESPSPGTVAVQRYDGSVLPADADGDTIRRLHLFEFVSGSPSRVVWLRSGPLVSAGGGDGLPPPGMDAQVLELNSGLEAQWGWMRYIVPE